MLRKHPNNTDVAIEVLKKYYVKEKGLFKVLIRWWNIGRCHEPWCMDIVQKFTWTPEKLAEFKPYEYVKERLDEEETSQES